VSLKGWVVPGNTISWAEAPDFGWTMLTLATAARSVAVPNLLSA
jgi:hypothetical protein